MSENLLLSDIKDVDIENFYSVKEVSKITKKAETTVRYWVREGKISSIKVMGPYGEQILIPKNEINKPVNNKDKETFITSKKDLDLQIVSKSIAQCILDEITIEIEKKNDKIDEILNVVKEMKEEKVTMQKEIEIIQEKHFKELDQKLSNIMEKKQVTKKSFISKIFSLFSKN